MINISWKDINNDVNNIEVLTSVDQVDEYDMVLVKFTLNNGRERIVRVFCDKGTVKYLENGSSKRWEPIVLDTDSREHRDVKRFLAEDLIDEDGLMNEQGRDDYIYLGECFSRNGMINWNQDENFSGKLLDFERKLPHLRKTIEGKSFKSGLEVQQINSTNSERKMGKSFAIADIHGMYGSYMEVIKRMNPSDHLYIIGDVIDRGNEGIKILLDIIQRLNNEQNNPKITFLLGNHEMMFLDAIMFMKAHEIDSEEMLELIENDNVDEQIKKWLYYTNRGEQTFIDYLGLQQQEQEAIIRFLVNAYIVIPQTIDDRDYLFVHSKPPKSKQLLQFMKDTGNGIKFIDYLRRTIDKRLYRFMLQDRNNDDTYILAKSIGFTTICGHTPKYGEIEEDDDKGFIRIDAGCGHSHLGGEKTYIQCYHDGRAPEEKTEVIKPSKLALYCIDDGSVQYLDEKEEADEKETSL